MKRAYYILLNVILVIITTTSCHHAQVVGVAPDGNTIARARLTFEEQREYDKLYLEAINQKLLDHYDAAYELLQRALTINPQASEALFEMGKMQLAFSHKTDSMLIAQSDSMLEEAVRLEPSNRYFRSVLAERKVRRGKYDEAAKLYQAMVEEKPKSQDVATLIRIYEALGDFSKALDAVKQLETLEGPDESTVMETFNIYSQMGKPEEGFAAIEALCSDNPSDTHYRILLGELYLQHNRKDEALAIFDDILSKEPGNQLVKIAMLQNFINEGDSVRFDSSMSEIMFDRKIENEQKLSLLQAYAGEALRGAKYCSKESIYKHFTEALSLPQYDSKMGELCLAFIEAAKLPEETTILPIKAILRDQPEHMHARLLMLSQYIKDEQIDEIIPLCEEGILQHPDALIFYYYAGAAYSQQDDTERSIATFERSKPHITQDADHGMASDILALLGDLYHRDNKKSEAFEAYEAALQHNPQNVLCLNNYAYFLSLESDQYEKALSMSKKVIEIEPNNPTYLDTYAWILYCMKQYTQARIYIDQTLKNILEEEVDDPQNASLYDHAGDIYFRCGEQKSALEHWNHALKITDDDELKTKLNKKTRTKRL